MLRTPPSTTRTDTRFPSWTLFRSGSEQKLLRQILRAGVDMERIENLRGSKRPPERACIAVMERRKGRGIAGIDANSAATVAIEHRLQPRRDVAQRLVPAHGCKFARAARALQRREDAVRVIGDREIGRAHV